MSACTTRISGAAINPTFISGMDDTYGNQGLALDSHNHIFVATSYTNNVREYDATTGALISAIFIDPQNLNGPAGMVVDNNNHLFVANSNGTTVGEFNATTGAVINANFINGQGLDEPYSLAFDSHNHLLVGNSHTQASVNEFDATTGAHINAFFLPGPNPGPNGIGAAMALTLDGSNHLFVLDFFGRVGQYDATTGATINETFVPASGSFGHYGLAYVNAVPEPSTFVLAGMGFFAFVACRWNFCRRLSTRFTSLIGIIASAARRMHRTGAVAIAPASLLCLVTLLATGFTSPSAHGGVLLVLSNDKVGEYDAATGAAINPNLILLPTPLPPRHGIAFDGNNRVFVSTAAEPGNGVSVFNATTGASINPNFINTPSSTPRQIALDGNNHLFVADTSTDLSVRGVGEYDATTGATIKQLFIDNSGGAPYGLLLDHNNHMFVSYFNGPVGEFDATTGAAINANFISFQINNPAGMALDAAHNHLFVSHFDSSSSTRVVGEYDATTGATINAVFISPGGIGAASLAFDNNNHLFVTTGAFGTVGEYDATTGATINAGFINQNFPQDVIFVPTLVPEPSTFVLAGMGFFVFVACRWNFCRRLRTSLQRCF